MQMIAKEAKEQKLEFRAWSVVESRTNQHLKFLVIKPNGEVFESKVSLTLVYDDPEQAAKRLVVSISKQIMDEEEME